jgi:hypothetical protein
MTRVALTIAPLLACGVPAHAATASCCSAVSDGAAVALDGRFWLPAQSLDQRWLALPRGAHTITVRPPGGHPIVRHVDVAPGKTLIVRF